MRQTLKLPSVKSGDTGLSYMSLHSKFCAFTFKYIWTRQWAHILTQQWMSYKIMSLTTLRLHEVFFHVIQRLTELSNQKMNSGNECWESEKCPTKKEKRERLMRGGLKVKKREIKCVMQECCLWFLGLMVGESEITLTKIKNKKKHTHANTHILHNTRLLD